MFNIQIIDLNNRITAGCQYIVDIQKYCFL